ncbi:sigma 54-interacting transcriptional regulator [Flavihumibacter petaseus]|uniref:Putative two-component response regulator n=1 Tax=Flavihumibacter petaseus NBRC 106054 TaxID=1220578 RepID=A0A0E9MW74_9BACT|nr:sigma 54-interacting transcriptional regulator [Flavihumibacter petaseus]GAO41758.1 putative two-component response regulator [Flavihumibacter petaseus NBRC 106054]
MKERILIVEDQFVEADYLSLMLEKKGYTVSGIARSVPEAKELIKEERPGFVLLDIFLKGKQTGIDLARNLAENNIPFVYLSANSNEEVLNAAKETQPYGFLVKPFRERDLFVMLEIARYRYEQSLESRLRREKDLKRKLEVLSKEKGGWKGKLLNMAKVLQVYLAFDCLAIKLKVFKEDSFNGFAFLRIGYDEYQAIGLTELSTISGMSPGKLKDLLASSSADETPGCYTGDQFEKLSVSHPIKQLLAKTFDFQSNLVIPFESSDGFSFSLSFFRRVPDGFNAEQLDWFLHLHEPLIGVFNSIHEEDRRVVLKQNEPFIAVNEMQHSTDFGFDGIIGTSPALLSVMDLVAQIAKQNTSVLLLGESGTGKERIADCIHNSSSRKGKPFVKINCAALPATLIESELFGHEKGAFTGAHEKRIGKFEKADGGTIFLDEIGEMPLELQVKLLRVLQEKEIERIGGKDTIKVDVRIIAATNRNLEKEVAEGRFRLDLYYRLNVFPICLPALRDRKEDIPALCQFFINVYSQKAGLKVSGISDKVLSSMNSYDWPGNIRELEHLIERGVLLAKGHIIQDLPLPKIDKKENGNSDEVLRIKTIQENERDHILSVLRKCNGRIWGAGAAAEILNIPPQTLQSRMKKLGIKKEYIR